MGIGLSAAAGFRIFVPFLVLSIASLSGYLGLGETFSWIGTVPALITFSIATLFEIGGYYIPWIDNLLDTIASPAAVIAGIILMASAVTGMSPLLKWSLAIIAGGGIAATVQTATSVTRAASTVTTGGIGNPVVSTAELGGSLSLSLLAVFIPAVAAVIVAGLLLWGVKTLLNKFSRKRKTL
jgi:hypothetical protein